MHHIRSWARHKARAENYNPFSASEDKPVIGSVPAFAPTPDATQRTIGKDAEARPRTSGPDHHDPNQQPAETTGNNVADNTSDALPPPAPPPAAAGETASPVEQPSAEKNVFVRFFSHMKEILLSSWINILLVFVPVGIAVHFAGASATVVFVMNALAIIPLAGLLSHATESVASRLGDTVGALINVTFGNAVELIIFIIALAKNEIRIVQASLLGSMLSNLLLILGMCFLFGGLRFREQIYNSTVTQMSACLLSLAVTSLLLPTAFHASFTDTDQADKAVLKVSRGTSIILLLVYILYLLFQLKSHAYMYESTPQHVIDEESHPGLLAEIMASSSDSSDGTASDSDGSSKSNTTAKRIRRVLRGRRRRKSSASSNQTGTLPSSPRTLSSGTARTNGTVLESPDASAVVESPIDMTNSGGQDLGTIASGDEADVEHDSRHGQRRLQDRSVFFKDFETERTTPGSTSQKKSKRRTRKGQDADQGLVEPKRSETQPMNSVPEVEASPSEKTETGNKLQQQDDAKTRISFANLRGLSGLSVPLPSVLSGTVFSSTAAGEPPSRGSPSYGPSRVGPSAIPPRVYGLRRTHSLPEGLDQARSIAGPPAILPPLSYVNPRTVVRQVTAVQEGEVQKELMSRTTAVLLLLISTGLVAVCAEFLVDSINSFVSNSGVSQTFVGLILLPIVGNAAEHVTAVTVASKNKMDLAIGVAVGSSIQIALFITPLIVLLGWCLSKDMSLYFSLFETVSLFVSAFIVNFLVLDGRSNYLEGALLTAAYVIIAVAAFFYPSSADQSALGGGDLPGR